MPDITMCKGEGCSAREKCYRYRAKPDAMWQSWFSKTPGVDETCEDFYRMPRMRNGLVTFEEPDEGVRND